MIARKMKNLQVEAICLVKRSLCLRATALPTQGTLEACHSSCSGAAQSTLTLGHCGQRDGVCSSLCATGVRTPARPLGALPFSLAGLLLALCGGRCLAVQVGYRSVDYLRRGGDPFNTSTRSETCVGKLVRSAGVLVKSFSLFLL